MFTQVKLNAFVERYGIVFLTDLFILRKSQTPLFYKAVQLAVAEDYIKRSLLFDHFSGSEKNCVSWLDYIFICFRKKPSWQGCGVQARTRNRRGFCRSDFLSCWPFLDLFPLLNIDVAAGIQFISSLQLSGDKYNE